MVLDACKQRKGVVVMPTVSFATHCHPPHLERLHKEGVLLDILKSHAFPFDEVLIVHQNCRGIPYRPITEIRHRVIESEDYYPQIFAEYGIKWPDPELDVLTHGLGAAHFWEAHTQNHLIELKEATGEYIVFADCDTKIIRSGVRSWVEEGIAVLRNNPMVFCVSPNDGANGRLTREMSQQLFLVNAGRMRAGPLGLPWNGKFDAPAGPMQEFYGMLEGRIGRLLAEKHWYRYVLSDQHRYWHYNPWEV